MHWLPNRSAPSRIRSGLQDRGGIHRSLVRPGQQHPADVVGGADAAADRQRDKDLFRGPPYHLHHRSAGVAARGDIEEHQFIGALRVVVPGDFDRIARIDQVDEIDPLDHAAAGHVHTGYDSFCQHR